MLRILSCSLLVFLFCGMAFFHNTPDQQKAREVQDWINKAPVWVDCNGRTYCAWQVLSQAGINAEIKTSKSFTGPGHMWVDWATRDGNYHGRINTYWPLEANKD